YILSKAIIFFSLFYLVQLLYALIDGFEYERFFLLTFYSFFITIYLSITFYKYSKLLLNSFVIIIGLFLILSISLNGHLIFLGRRFLGFANNPNLYGITALFWLAILFLKIQEKDRYRGLSYVLVTITIL